MAAVAGLAAVLIAFDLMRAFPAQISASGGDTGLNTFKMIYRHMSPALVPLLMVPAFICDRIVAKQEQARLVARWQGPVRPVRRAPVQGWGKHLGPPAGGADGIGFP